MVHCRLRHHKYTISPVPADGLKVAEVVPVSLAGVSDGGLTPVADDDGK